MAAAGEVERSVLLAVEDRYRPAAGQNHLAAAGGCH